MDSFTRKDTIPADKKMMFPNSNNFSVAVEKQGPVSILKNSFPLRYGKYSEIKTPEYEFRFNLNGEIKFIRGLGANWTHPAEQLKRTDGNDWVFYTVGDKSGDQGIISWLGEYYLPCLPYLSNSVWEINYFSNSGIMNAFAAWSQLYADLYSGSSRDRLHPRAKNLIDLILQNNDNVLYERSGQLQEIIGGRVTVLPPDTRHVDYEVIPIMVSDGCLYHCKFCCVKSVQKYQKRSKNDILTQIQQLKTYYGRNLENYHALFLGNHDALASGEELLLFAASEAYKAFGFGQHRAKTPLLFLFGSVDSLLKSEDRLFKALNELPFYTYINVGFESVDISTLELVGKPVTTSMVRDAFRKIQDINTAYANIEVTGNFLVGEQLSNQHYQSLAGLLQEADVSSTSKGAIYLSPLQDSPKKRELLPRFFEIKNQSRLPVYMYLIQRL